MPDDIISELKKKYGISKTTSTDAGVSKVKRAAERLRSLGLDVPDDVADDFDKVTGLESGRSHFNADGSVKRGVPTKDGSRAIGYGQIMPGTAKPYQDKYGLDPEKEDDNIAMSLAEYQAGDEKGPVARRLAYVGGKGSKALAHYKQTGEVPDWKLYSYLPNNKETYRSYVERSGGLASKQPQAPAPFDYKAKMGSILGDKKSPATPAPTPTFPSDSYLPPDTPFNDDAKPNQTSLQQPPAVRPGFEPRPIAPGEKHWEFERTGRAGGLDYIGRGGQDKHFAKDADGNDYEFDEASKIFKPTKPLPLKLKLESGEELKEAPAGPADKPLANGAKRLVGPKGKKFIATPTETKKDKDGNETTSFAIVEDKPAEPLQVAKLAKSAEPQIAQETRSYGFEQSGTLKLGSGEELALDRSTEAPEGKFRFRDADGESYLFDKESGQLEDESLKEVAARFPVAKISHDKRNVVPIDAAKKSRAAQVAQQVSVQYGIDPDDANEWLLNRGFTDIATGAELPEDRYYQTRDELNKKSRAAMAGNNRIQRPGEPFDSPKLDQADDTHTLTRRDLRDLSRFHQEAKQKRENLILEHIAKGEEPTPEMLRQFRIHPGDLTDKRYDEYQKALVVGRVNKDELDRRIPKLIEAGNDQFRARLIAKQQMGLIDAKAADAELKGYEQIKNEQRDYYSKLAYWATPMTGAFGARYFLEKTPDVRAEEQAETILKRYGTAGEYWKQREFREAQEAASRARLDAMNWNEYAQAIPGQWVKGVNKSVLKAIIADGLRSSVVWTGGFVDLLESITGSAIKGDRQFNEKHPWYKAAGTFEEYLDKPGDLFRDLSKPFLPARSARTLGNWIDWGLKTNKDLDDDIFLGKIPHAVGNSLAFLLPSLSSKPKVATAFYSTFMMGGMNYEEAIRSGASEEEAQKYAFWTALPLGWTEILGVNKAFARLNQGVGGTVWRQYFREALPAAAREVAEETAANEFPQMVGENVFARLTFAPDREWDKGFAERMIVAGFGALPITLGATAINTIKHQKAIRRQLEADARHGGINFRNFGNAGVFIYGKEVPISDKMKPLLEKHKAVVDEIQFAQATIAQIREKAMQLEPEQRYSAWRTIRDLREEVNKLYIEQKAAADEIIKISGATAPSMAEQKAAWEDAKKAVDETAAETPETIPAPVSDGFDLTHQDGRRFKVVEDRGKLQVQNSEGDVGYGRGTSPYLLVEDDRGRVSLQPERKFKDLGEYRNRMMPQQYTPEIEPELQTIADEKGLTEQQTQGIQAKTNELLGEAPKTEFVHERDVTLKAQHDAMMDDKQPKAMAVLYTDPKAATKEKGTSSFTLPDGELVVNNKKFKEKYGEHPSTKRLEIESETIPLADLIGKAVSDRDTTKGTAVVTVDADGNELTASKVPDAKAAQKQAELDRERFGDRAAESGLADTDEIIASREEDRPIEIEPVKGKRNRAIIEPPRPADTTDRTEKPVKRPTTAISRFEDRTLGRLGYSENDRDSLSEDDRKRILKERITKRDFYRKSEKVFTPILLDKPIGLEISPSTRRRLKKKHTASRLLRKGYKFTFTGKDRIRITHAPAGKAEEVAGNFEMLVFETDEARRSKIGSGNAKNLKTTNTAKASLSQYVRGMGGFRPNKYQEGELRRVSVTELGPGYINKNSRWSVDEAAKAVYEAGYLRDLWESTEHVNSDEFLQALEDDARGIHKHYSRESDVSIGIDEVSNIPADERERLKKGIIEDVLAGMGDIEFQLTTKIEDLLADDRVWPVLEKVEFEGKISPEDLNLFIKRGKEYGLTENESRAVLDELRRDIKEREDAAAAATEAEPAAVVDGTPVGDESGEADSESIYEDEFLDETEPEEDDVDLSFDFGENVEEVDVDVEPPATEAAHDAATSPNNDLPEPSQAMKEAGNYRKGHLKINGLDISIENPVGSTRSGTDPKGKKWEVVMRQHYGYIKRTTGADDEQIDLFVKDGTPADFSGDVYVIDQNNRDGSFDEHKVMLGYGSEAEASEAYLSNYEKGWTGLGKMTPMSIDEFKEWVASVQEHPAAEGGSLFDAAPAAKDPKSFVDIVGETEAALWLDDWGSANITGSTSIAGQKDLILSLRHLKDLLPELAKLKKAEAENLINEIWTGVQSWFTANDVKADTPLSEAFKKAMPIGLKGKVRDELDRLLSPNVVVEEAEAFDNVFQFTDAEKEAEKADTTVPSTKTTIDDLRTPDNGMLFGVEAEPTGLFAQKPIEPAPPIDDAKQKAVDELKEKQRASDEKKNIKIFGDYEGEMLTRLASEAHPTIRSAAKAVISRRNDIARLGNDALQLVEDVAAAVVKMQNAQIEGTDFETYVNNKSLFGEDGELTPDQRDWYFSLTEDGQDATVFVDRFNSAVDELLAQAGKKSPRPAEIEEATEGVPVVLITDFGEKIGGARKDTAESGFSMSGRGKSAKKENDRPSWMKGFELGATPGGKFRPLLASDGRFRQIIWESKQEFDTEEEATDAIKAFVVTRKFRVRKTSDAQTWEVYRRVTQRKFHTIQDGFESEDAAMRYIATHLDELVAFRPQFPDRPHIEDLKRTGKQHRSKDVTVEEFLAMFGFTGGEFGNWVPQDERRRILNMAFDGLMDLSEVLGIPPRAISLNGQLSIAFGSRGHGLSGAAAHYEPKRAVFNLTRLNGAGAVAHEWFHALDHYFGAQNQGKTLEKDEEGIVKAGKPAEAHMLSHAGVYRTAKRSREEIQTAFKNLIQTIYKQPKIVEVSVDRFEKQMESSQRYLENELNGLRSHLLRSDRYGRKKKPATDEQIAKFDDLAARIRAGDVGEPATIETKERMFNKISTTQVFKDLNELVVEVTGRSSFKRDHGAVRDINAHSNRLQNAIKQLAHYRLDNKETRLSPTKFAYDAKDIDAMRSSDYYTTEHEMAARAFEAFVEDQLKASGDVSQYLVHSTENSIYKILYGLHPYPEGVERERINQAFRDFFDIVETEETDRGVMLRSVATNDKLLAPNGKPSNLTPAQYRAVRTPEFKDYFGDWQSAARQQQILSGSPVEISSTTTDRQRLFEDARDRFQGKRVFNADFGRPIQITGRGLKHIKATSGDLRKARVLSDTDAILEKGVFLGSEPDRTGNNNIRQYHRLATPVRLNGERFIVESVVRETNIGDLLYDFGLSDIVRPAGISGEVSETESSLQPAAGSTGSTLLRNLLDFNPENVSTAVDENGEPLVVYRGEHGETGEQFQTTRGSLSFGDAETASFYAESPNDRNMTPHAPRVVPAYLSIQKPVIDTPDDPFIGGSDLVAAVGKDAAREIILRHADWVESTNNWEENFAGNYDGVEGLLDAKPDAISDLYLQAYPVFDDAEAVAAFKAAGYDGAIHAGAGENSDRTEYKIFDEKQAKSLGNRGTFDPASPNILHKKRDADSVELLTEILPNAHTQDVFEGIASEMEGDDLYVNEYAAEEIRRLIGLQYFLFYGVEHDQPTVDGLTWGAGQIEGIAALGREMHIDYLAAGYTEAQLAGRSKLLDDLDRVANINQDYAVIFTFNDALPEEKFHQEDLRAGRTDIEAIDELKKTSIWKDPGKRFTDEYPDLSDADKASELAAKLATGQAGKYGWTTIENFEEVRREFLKTWIEGILRTNAEEIESKGSEEFRNRFQRINKLYAEVATDNKGTSPKDRGKQRSVKDRRRRDARKGDAAAEGAKAADTRKKESGNNRTSQVEREVERSRLAERLEAERLKVLPGEVRIKNRKHAQTLRDNGRTVADVPYVTGTDPERIVEVEGIIAASLRAAELSNFTRGDYEHALEIYFHPDTAGRTKTVLGIALIDHLGSAGELALMNQIADTHINHVGQAAEALQAASIAAKYDFAKAIVLAKKIYAKQGRDIPEKVVDKLKKLTRELNNAVREKAMADQTIADAEQVMAEMQAEVDEMTEALRESRNSPDTDPEEMQQLSAALDEQADEIERKSKLIENLKRQLARWKNKVLGTSEATIRVAKTHRELLERRSIIREKLAAAFPGRPLRSVLVGDEFTPEERRQRQEDTAFRRRAGDALGKYTTDWLKEVVNVGRDDVFAVIPEDLADRVLEKIRSLDNSAGGDLSPSSEMGREFGSHKGALTGALVRYGRGKLALEKGHKNASQERVDADHARVEELIAAKDGHHTGDVLNSTDPELNEAEIRAMAESYPDPDSIEAQESHIPNRISDGGKYIDKLPNSKAQRDALLRDVLSRAEAGLEELISDYQKLREDLESVDDESLNVKGWGRRDLAVQSALGSHVSWIAGERGNIQRIERMLQDDSAEPSIDGPLFGGLRSVASSDEFDDEIRTALVQYAALKIFDGESYEATIAAITDLTDGVLNADEIAAIHADAEAFTHKDRTPRSPEIIAKAKAKSEHRRRAEAFRKGEQTERAGIKLDRLDKQILLLADKDEQLGDAGVFLNNASSVDDWFKAIRSSFPDLTEKQLQDLYVRARELRDRARKEIVKQIAEVKHDIKFINDEKFEDWKQGQLIAASLARRHKSTLDVFWRKQHESFADKALNAAQQTTGVFKGMSATGEISMVFRQNLLLWVTHPIRTGRQFGAIGRGFGSVAAGSKSHLTKDTVLGNFMDAAGEWSETQLLAYMEALRQNPYFDDAQAHRLELSSIGDFNIQDEHFVTSVFNAFAEARKAWFMDEKNAGTNMALMPVRIFGRTYKALEIANTLFGDAARLATYSYYAEYIDSLPMKAVEKRKAKSYAAVVVNAFGGRGDVKGVMGKNGALAKLANLSFFSLRLLISRPQSLYHLTFGFALAPKGMRIHMLSEGLKFYGFIALLHLLFELRLNPWDDEFGKIKIKPLDLNIDPLAGMDAPMNWLFSISEGMVRQVGATIRGEDSDVLERNFDRLFKKYWYNPDAAKRDDSWIGGLRYWRGKSSPFVSLNFDYFTGRDFIGREFSWKNAMQSRLIPLAYTQTYQALYYDRYAAVMKEQSTATGDLDLMNGLIMITGTGIGFGITQYPREDSTEAESLAWEMYEPRSPDKKKAPEQRRAEIGLRNLFRMRKKMQAEGLDISRVEASIAKYAKAYEIDPKLLTKLRKQGEEGDFAFITQQLDVDQVRKILSVATPAQRPELEAILAKKEENAAKRDAPPKPMANRLHTAAVEESIKLWTENSAEFTPQQQLEFKRRLRQKVMKSNKSRTLDRENYDAAKKILGTLPPYLGKRKKADKPIKGLDSLKGVNFVEGGTTGVYPHNLIPSEALLPKLTPGTPRRFGKMAMMHGTTENMIDDRSGSEYRKVADHLLFSPRFEGYDLGTDLEAVNKNFAKAVNDVDVKKLTKLERDTLRNMAKREWDDIQTDNIDLDSVGSKALKNLIAKLR